jgi:5'-methylthioadenosine phosphorylase
MSLAAEIGIFGGSGFYEWLDAADEIEIETPYGPPSGSIALAEVGGRSVAFLPRHGPNHEVSAPFVNYRANV